ncbi:MAG: TerC/Alx family metal homeostasis membrane protein [Proteobacteria bacterium]|nr:TerC/Alx family metal homeostasis membrane protein [Pseudomonadota bacterium]
MEYSYLFWLGFLAFVAVAIAFDLLWFASKPQGPTTKESLYMSACWASAAMIFAALIYGYAGPNKAAEFITGYLVELSLSMDNVFVIAMVFSCLKTPQIYQHRVLFWGVTGAIVMRFILIWAGVEVIKHFQWIFYVFSAILIASAYKMVVVRHDTAGSEDSAILSLLERYLNVTKEYAGEQFFVRKNGKIMATPLLAALLLVEKADLIFAIDSIPAILSITQDIFIVFTSNIFAIIGLRSLYFLLANAIASFRYLRHGLALVLLYVGIKILFMMQGVHLPVALSLAIIIISLGVSIALSIMRKDK